MAKTHGMWKSKEWNSWDHLKRRCNNPNDPKYKLYGGQGIKVCDSWVGKDGFANFLKDMGKAPSKSHSIDRFPDKNGNYEPSNCRWATPLEQSNNTRGNIAVSYKGTTLTVSQWAKKLKITRDIFNRRLKNLFEPQASGSKNRTKERTL